MNEISSSFDFIQQGKEVLNIEIQALQHLTHYIDDNFEAACRLILNQSGKVIVMGMGKSGHIGRKIAATLASTGTPAFFVHPGEASHGDLGMLSRQDLVLAISNSGETHELVSLLPVLKRIGIPVISMTGNPNSTLSTHSNIPLQITVEKEACPLNLAPTSSTTVTLALGDALAVALMKARGFTANDFALSHPGGALGRKLLLKLRDIMHSGDELPRVLATASLKEALLEISQKGLGIAIVVNENNQLEGIFTDGDLRRFLDTQRDIHTTCIGDVMTCDPTTAQPDDLAAEGLKLMEAHKINALVLLEEQQVMGALNMHDLLKAGVL